MKHRRLIGIGLSLALTLSLGTSALATGGTLPPGTHTTEGDSTISIMTAAVDPKNVSFTVPLYVTLAVVANDADVKTPDNYQITNTSNGGNPSNDYKIGVTAVSFEKLSATGFNTVAAEGSVAADTDIYLTIGGLAMPAMNSQDTKAVTTTTASAFGESNAPKPIDVNASMALPITGKVTNAARQGTATAAQFRVRYTISLLSNGTDPLGLVYAGNDSNAAGLGPNYQP